MTATPGDAVRRKCDYRLSGLGWLGLYMVVFGLVWMAAILFMAYGVAHMTESVRAHSSPVSVLVPALIVFGSIGIGILVSGIKHLLAVKNEFIAVDGNHVSYTNDRGEVSLRFTLEQIQDVEEQVVTHPTTTRAAFAPIHHKCVVTTSAGKLAFSDDISDYDWLKSLFIKNETVMPTGGSSRYRRASIFLVAAFVFPLTFVLCYYGITGYMNGEIMTNNGVPEITPIWFPMAIVAASSLFWLTFGYYILQSLFERIYIADNKVAYINVFGKKTIEVPLAWIEQGSYQERTSSRQSGSTIYSVATPQGSIKWSDAITRCTALTQILCKAAGGHPLNF